VDDLERLTGMEVSPVLSTRAEIESAINKYYKELSIDDVEDILKDIPDSKIEVLQDNPKQELVEVSVQSIREGPVVRATNFILGDSVSNRASDVLLEPMERRMRIRYRIDGVLKEVEAPPVNMYPLIISRIKVMSNLDIAEHRLPQDGRFRIKIEGRNIDFRVSIIPSILGEKASIRVLDKDASLKDIDNLGFSADVVERIKTVSSHPHGMIIACGPTGSGKTTTLYSILKHIYSPTKNIITVEDPIEYELRGINQVSVNQEVGLTFASSLRSILRQDPDIVMVGEIRDFETVDIAKAALTGHLVLSTLHTTTAVGAVIRLINMGVEPFLITSSLIGVVAQRLMRRLCDKCKEEYVPTEIILDKFNVKQGDIKFYRPKGCKECNFTGYTGRVGIAEALPITYEVKEQILKGSNEHQIRDKATELGMKSFKDDAFEKATLGITSLEEVLRVAGV
ncbi:MAG TPA: GspE/PulE family protein, partial [bacterium]|nr:GspE/PulE family protein [bacterium]